MDDFLLYFACGTSLLCPAIISLGLVCLGSSFPWWKYPVEITLPTHCSAPSFLGRSLSDSPRKKIFKGILHPEA